MAWLYQAAYEREQILEAQRAELTYYAMVTAAFGVMGAVYGSDTEIPPNLGLLDALQSKQNGTEDTKQGGQIRHFTEGAPDVLSVL